MSNTQSPQRYLKSSELSSRHDSMSINSFRKLPVEIHTAIFMCALSPQIITDTMMVSTLQLVCRHWSDIVLCAPGLWATFNIKLITSEMLDSYEAKLDSKVSLWLKLSNKYPLTIHLTCEPSAPPPHNPLVTNILAKLLVEAYRWHDMSFCIPSAIAEPLIHMPSHNIVELRHFSIDTVTVSSKNSSYAHAFNANPLHLGYFVQWAGSLTELSLFGSALLTLDDCLDILRDAKELVVLRLAVGCAFRSRESVETKSVRALELRLLDSESGTSNVESLIAFLGTVRFLNIDSLCLQWFVHEDLGARWEECHSALREMTMASGRALRQVDLENFPSEWEANESETSTFME